MEIKSNYPEKMDINRQRVMFMMAFLLPLFFFASCKKEQTETPNKAKLSVFQYISQNKQLSLYQVALKRAGMYNAETFSNGGPFTVFAPVDSAFISAGLTADSINRYDPQALAMALKYGIVYGKISAGSLVGFYAEDVSTLNTLYKPNLVKNYYGVFFNGVPIASGSSVDLNDGVVHQLPKVALPPGGTLLDVIKNTPNLTLLAATIKALNLETQYSTVSANSYYYALFAPTDEAFKKFGYPDVASINANPSKLQSIMDASRLFSATQKLFTSSFIGGYAISAKYFYVKPDGFTIISIGNTLPIHIIRANIVATNGVLHVVDQVITPFVF